jgi:hypothetical protein
MNFLEIVAIGFVAVVTLSSCGDNGPELGTVCEDVIKKLETCFTDDMIKDYYGDCKGNKAVSAKCRIDGCHCDGKEFVCAKNTCAPE